MYGADGYVNPAPWQGKAKWELFSERDERVHGQYRRLISRPYSLASLKTLEPYVDNAIRVLIRRLSDFKPGLAFDISPWMQLFAFGK